MTVQKPLLLSLGATALMAALSAWAWPHTPPAIAVHFGLDGAPDRYGSRAEGLLMMPVMALVLTVVFAALPRIMPAGGKLERSRAAYVVSWLGAVLLLGAVHTAVTLNAMGAPVDVVRIATGFVGALLVAIGDVMGKARYNYVVGVRTPWTLASERVWDKTHRAAGPWMMAGGLVIVLAAIFAPSTAQGHGALLAATLLGALTPVLAAVIYSYVAARRLGEV